EGFYPRCLYRGRSASGEGGPLCSWRRSCFHCSNSSKLLKRKTPFGLIGFGNKLRAVRCRRSKRSQYDGRFFPPTVLMFGSSFIDAIITVPAHGSREIIAS